MLYKLTLISQKITHFFNFQSEWSVLTDHVTQLAESVTQLTTRLALLEQETRGRLEPLEKKCKSKQKKVFVKRMFSCS